MVMSAVSSVSTPGVEVTVMPRWRAVARSIWSTPVPKEAIRRRFGLAWARMRESIRSVTVGTTTSATFTASISSAWLKAWSSWFRRVSNSSIIRVSIASGSFRVTITNGFFVGIRSPRVAACPARLKVRHGYFYLADLKPDHKHRMGLMHSLGAA